MFNSTIIHYRLWRHTGNYNWFHTEIGHDRLMKDVNVLCTYKNICVLNLITFVYCHYPKKCALNRNRGTLILNIWDLYAQKGVSKRCFYNRRIGHFKFLFCVSWLRKKLLVALHVLRARVIKKKIDNLFFNNQNYSLICIYAHFQILQPGRNWILTDILNGFKNFLSIFIKRLIV